MDAAAAGADLPVEPFEPDERAVADFDAEDEDDPEEGSEDDPEDGDDPEDDSEDEDDPEALDESELSDEPPEDPLPRPFDASRLSVR